MLLRLRKTAHRPCSEIDERVGRTARVIYVFLPVQPYDCGHVLHEGKQVARARLLPDQKGKGKGGGRRGERKVLVEVVVEGGF